MMASLDHPNPTGDDGQANKRRKVNTCLQCKSRKVKCDKVRPHCGPCQRRRIPVDRCIWADEADPETMQQFGEAEWSTAAYDTSHSHSQPQPASGGSLLGLSETDARAVLERISRLEMRIKNDAPEFQAPAPVPSHQIDPLMLAGATAAGVAHARALHTSDRVGDAAGQATLPQDAAMAILAQQAVNPQLTSTTNVADENRFPFAIEASREHTKYILGLLPNDHVVNVLLDSFRQVEAASPLGISWRLIRVQLINLRGEVADWRSGQIEEPDVDLSFLALLFQLMVCAIECKAIDEVVREGIAASAEQVPEMIEGWHSTAQALLAMADFMEQPNINTILAVSLFRIYLVKAGQGFRIKTYLEMCVSMARKLGIHRLGTATDDAARWESTPESEDVSLRTGPVTAMRKALFEGGETFALEEEARLIRAIRSSSNAPERREHVGTLIPERSHLVREAARSLWCALGWQLALLDGTDINGSDATSRPICIDESGLPDGETSQLELPVKEQSQPLETWHTSLWSQARELHSVKQGIGSALQAGPPSHIEGSQRTVLEAVGHWSKLVTQRTQLTGAGAPMIQVARDLLSSVATVRTMAPAFAHFLDLAEFNACLVLAVHSESCDTTPTGHRASTIISALRRSAVKLEDPVREYDVLSEHHPARAYLDHIRARSDVLSQPAFFNLLDAFVSSVV